MKNKWLLLLCFSQHLSVFKFFIQGCVACHRYSTSLPPRRPAPLQTTQRRNPTEQQGNSVPVFSGYRLQSR